MKVLISEKLSEHKYKTPEGYLICTDAILARTGKQSYTKDELFQDGDNTEVNVDRPYDEVMNAKTIASFENKPITFDHPDEDVNVGNYKDYAIGYVRDVRQGKTDKGEDVILGNLVITDQDAINAIEQGDHTDLSCGYDCDIRDDGNGNYSQTNIRGNHLALCEQGRAGIARIVDSKVIDKKRWEVGYRVRYEGRWYYVIAYSKGDWVLEPENGSRGDYIYVRAEDSKSEDSKVEDDNLLGKRVRIRKRYSNLDGTIGTIYSYEGTNYDDEVEVKRNGHIYKVNYEDIEFLDSKVEDVNYSEKEIKEAAMKLLEQKPFLTYEEALQKVKENIRNGNYLLDSKVKDSLSKKEKELCNYMLENALDDGEDENDLLKKMKVYYSEYSNLARSKPNEVLRYFKSHIDNDEIEDSMNDAKDSKEMTMSDAIKMLNIVDIYKKVKDSYIVVRNKSKYEDAARKLGLAIEKDSKSLRIYGDKYKLKQLQNQFDNDEEISYVVIKDASKDKLVIKNTGLAYEIWNQGKMVKKFPTKKLAIEWIHSRFPTDEITEDSTKDGRLWQTLTRKAKH